MRRYNLNFNIIDIQPTQVTIELENEECYRLKESVEVAVRKIAVSPVQAGTEPE